MASDNNVNNFTVREKIRGSKYFVSKRNSPKSPCGKCLGSGGENVLLGAGIFLLSFGIVMNLFWVDVLEFAINKEFVLDKSSTSFKLWVKNPIPLYLDIYFHNWTNPSDLKDPSYKPEFEELGPYRFREDIEKVNLVWNENGTITYKKLRTWYFDAEHSNGSLNDNITSLNVIALSAVRTTRSWSKVMRAPLSIAIGTTQKIYVTKKAGEFLFEGFSDPLIDVATTIPGLAHQVPFDRFGWFYKRNASTEFDGVFNVETGANGMHTFGKIKNWNYKNHTPYYEGHCGDVTGSGGEFWPPKRTKYEDVTFFAPDLCRYVTFKYTKEVEINGIKGLRYDAGAELFDNGTADPSNECFCNGECVPSGVANVSACRFGAPGFVSYPHFFRADPWYRTNILGMRPDPKKHDMYMVLEPNLGIPLEVAVRLQINIFLRPDSGIWMYKGVPAVFFPIIWFEQKVETPESMLGSLRLLLALPMIGLVSSIVILAFGTIFILLFVIGKYCKNKALKKDSKTAKETEEEIPIRTKKSHIVLSNKPKKDTRVNSYL